MKIYKMNEKKKRTIDKYNILEINMTCKKMK